VGTYKYRSLASQLAVLATGVAAQQSRHFRTALGGSNRELQSAVLAAATAVLTGGSDLVSPNLEDVPAFIRKAILDPKRRRGRFDVQLELEIARRFAIRTDRMAQRCLDLARLALKASPGETVRRFLGRIGRSYMAGLFPESVIMCRAVLEQAVLEKFQREGKPPPQPPRGKSEVGARLARAEELGWITRKQRREAWDIHIRGSKAVHQDPELTTDVLGTIAATVAILDALYLGA
jgi:hypothetical protein